MDIVLSFDVDRTLVDRSESSHGIGDKIIEALHDAENSEMVSVLLNTGRDITALSEFDFRLGIELDALFLSGRGQRLRGEVSAIDEAVLSTQLIGRAASFSRQIGLPFLDIKTARGTVQMTFGEGEISFGMQKPVDWYQVTSPLVLDGHDPSILQTVESLLPLRLEVPCHRFFIAELERELDVSESHSLYVLSVHSDFLRRNIEEWAFLQVMSPVGVHNKGAALKQYVDRAEQQVFVVHFGDSDSNHNDDLIVRDYLPRVDYVHVDWESDIKQNIEETIVEEIRKYL